MDPTILKNLLNKRIALLPGCRARNGGGIIVFPSQGELKEFPYSDVVSILNYLSHLIDPLAKPGGFTVIVDMRSSWIKYLKTILRACQAALYGNVHQVLIIKPEQFLEKSKINLDLMIEAYDLKTTIVSVHKLSRHVDVTELPQPLGGTYPYNHQHWMNVIMKYEEYSREHSLVQRKLHHSLNNSRQVSYASDGESTTEYQSDTDQFNFHLLPNFVEKGEKLMKELEGERTDRESITPVSIPNPEFLHAANNIRTFLASIKNQEESEKVRMKTLEREREKEARSQKHQSQIALYDQHSSAVANLCDWLIGPGEKWLLTLHEIGESKDEAEQLERDHDQLGQKADEIMSQVSELSRISNKLLESNHPRSADIARHRLHSSILPHKDALK